MGQFWRVLNPDCREELGGAKLGEVFFDGCGWDYLIEKLRIPCLPVEVDDWLSGGREVSQTSHLANLPTEILNLILDEVSNLCHLASFAVTCKDMLVVAKPYLLKGLKSEYASWAGTRLICLGEYTNDVDLPAGFLTEEELNEAQNTYVPGYCNREEYDKIKCYDIFATETYEHVGSRRYYDITGYYELRSRLERGFHGHRVESSAAAVYWKDYEKFDRLCGRFTQAYPKGEPVLFNLTKGECVRSEPMWGWEDTNEAHVSFGHALLARICWSGREPENNAMWLDKAQYQELGRGKWAGDRFCVTTLEMMPHTQEGREWVDVSEEVAAFIFHLWRHDIRHDPLCATVVEAKVEAVSRKRARDSLNEAEAAANGEQSQPKTKKAKTTRVKKEPKVKKPTRKSQRKKSKA